MAQKPKVLSWTCAITAAATWTLASAVASEFIHHGVIVSEQSGNGTKTPYQAIPGGLATNIPLVVLVNGYSASASEIVSGAIQDDGRGKLVGVTTYGKGTVQNWVPLNNEGALSASPLPDG